MVGAAELVDDESIEVVEWHVIGLSPGAPTGPKDPGLLASDSAGKNPIPIMTRQIMSATIFVDGVVLN